MFGEESYLSVLIAASRNLGSQYGRCSCALAEGEVTLSLIFLRTRIISFRIAVKNARAGTPKAFDLFNRSNISGDMRRGGLQGGNISRQECRVLHFQSGTPRVCTLKMFPLAKIILSLYHPLLPFIKKRPRANNLVQLKSIKYWNFQAKAAVRVCKPSSLLLLCYIGYNSL